MGNREPNLPGQYDAQFFAQNLAGSLSSARAYAERLAQVWQPESVVDFGCGKGTWLEAFAERGATRLTGLDQTEPDGGESPFRAIVGDLNEIIHGEPDGPPYDLAMSLEVAEHLDPKSSAQAVRYLSGLSDVILFGAAFLHQHGVQHINLRRHSFWAQLFERHGYGVHDFFRPQMWGRPEVEFWYQQNTFLYVKHGHALADVLACAGFPALERLEFLDCVHPQLLEDWVGLALTVPRRTLLQKVADRVARLSNGRF